MKDCSNTSCGENEAQKRFNVFRNCARSVEPLPIDPGRCFLHTGYRTIRS
jgi:hypothetical protein